MARSYSAIAPALAFLLPMGFHAMAQHSPVGSATRSDSIDILHTRVDLDLANTANGLIQGKATITFHPLVPGIGTLPLDLLLPVDSVVMNGIQLPFTQANEVLLINLNGNHGPADTLALAVSYHGHPVTDPSGFGGFYTLSTYQYDLGVAFDAVPHSYGRSWFPCFDNFVERCTFDYFVHTTGGRSVFANGLQQGINDIGNGERITHWHMADPIPSYLASVAAGNYAALHDTFPSVSGAEVPVVLAALPADTARMRSSFTHLKNAFDSFEHWFGPYRWDRVGYVLTSAGAMEHATNICYPDFAADGTLGNEDLFAHELSHHWFGDLITCAKPEEMYINEGFADFCANLFMENLYGPAAYNARVKANHHEVVASAHLRDTGWYALANVPQNVTYGATSYKKGSDIARTLRTVMGDSLFSMAFKHVFAANAYRPMGSAALRDSLAIAANLDLSDFFQDWIFQPGGAAFMVDSFTVSPNGTLFDVQVFIRQKTRGGADFFHHVPVSFTCIAADGSIHRQTTDLGSAYTTVVLTCPFPPALVRLNDDERLALSSTVDTATIASIGQKNLGNADLWIVTSALPGGPAKVRVEEFWVAADPVAASDGAYVISPDRWWRVEGTMPSGTQMKLRFTVDGRAGTFTAYDQGLTAGSAFVEDSLLVLYRPNAGAPWMPKPCTLFFLGLHTDKYARIDMDGLAPGDYALAWRNAPTGLRTKDRTVNGWRLYPDPASQYVTVEAPAHELPDRAELEVLDMNGRLILRQAFRSSPMRLDVSRVAAQAVLLSVRLPDGSSMPLGRLQLVH